MSKANQLGYSGDKSLRDNIMDIIEIKGIQLKAIVGVNAWEKQLPQSLVVDLAYKVDASQISQSDDLAQSIDYDAMTNFCINFISETQVGLIETLSDKLAQALLQQFNLPWLRLTLHKPHALTCAKDISITLERHA